MTKQDVLVQIDKKIDTAWKMVDLFMQNRDAHGVMDMGAELQALQRAKAEVEQIS